ncbi:hypothetical protein [Billgrantia kenyensis]|uniref:Uncharacterized protein n=1 Tax=Billgrantia kenyensis TaxID=321266 RepID=A0A7V9W547_9GAMM|nr:hypothetical protein [Halomonas kenyensis]MBA2781199.1 hypothetical protein [Halomonas kenyensis]MCG6663880.1 hypothetical protein [Halomonas kenyensis]
MNDQRSRAKTMAQAQPIRPAPATPTCIIISSAPVLHVAAQMLNHTLDNSRKTLFTSRTQALPLQLKLLYSKEKPDLFIDYTRYL